MTVSIELSEGRRSAYGDALDLLARMLVEDERTLGLRPVRLSPADMDLPSHGWGRLPSAARRRSRAAVPAPGADVPFTYPYPSEAPRPDFSR